MVVAASDMNTWWYLVGCCKPGGTNLQTFLVTFLDVASIFGFPVQEQWTTDQRPSLEARP